METALLLVLHADNGSPHKGSTLMATLEHLGVIPSHRRPHLSDDSAYAETLFRTLKYRPAYPANGFADLAEARAWVLAFVGWYNTEHRHSPPAKAAHPERWRHTPRNYITSRPHPTFAGLIWDFLLRGCRKPLSRSTIGHMVDYTPPSSELLLDQAWRRP